MSSCSRDAVTHSLIKKQIGLAVAYPRAAALVTTPPGCLPAPPAGAAVYKLTPDSVKVTAGVVAGEMTGMEVTECIEEGFGRAANRAKLTGKLALKNISSNQVVRLMKGKIIYIDLQGHLIELDKNRTESTIKITSSYGSSDRLDLGHDATYSVHADFPAEALKTKILKEIRLELCFIPSPLKA